MDEIKAQVAAAEAEKRLYGGVDVMITDVNGTEIEFVVYGDRTGTRHTADFSDRTQVWGKCPCTLPADAADPAPGKREYGKLYLSEQYLQDHSIAAAPKWPPRMDGPEPPTARLEMFPLKLELTGVEMKSGNFEKTTIDLLDPAYAKSKQTLELDGSAPISVELTEASFGLMYLPFTPDAGQIADAVETIRKPKSRRDLAAALIVVGKTAAAIEDGQDVDGKLREKIDEILAKLT